MVCFGLQGNHHQGASQRLAKITHLVHVDTKIACFGLQENHHQGASQRLAKITHLVHVDTQMACTAIYVST